MSTFDSQARFLEFEESLDGYCPTSFAKKTAEQERIVKPVPTKTLIGYSVLDSSSDSISYRLEFKHHFQNITLGRNDAGMLEDISEELTAISYLKSPVFVQGPYTNKDDISYRGLLHTLEKDYDLLDVGKKELKLVPKRHAVMKTTPRPRCQGVH